LKAKPPAGPAERRQGAREMAKTFLAVAVASNLIAALLAEWPVNLLVAAGGVAGFALVEHLSRAAGRGP
jgi:hypothetical protein